MQNYNGTIVTNGRHSHFVPSKSGKYAQLQQKQQEQLEKLAQNKKYRQQHPSSWETDRDLSLLLRKH